MQWMNVSACAVIAALGMLGCTRPVVPAHVRARVAYREFNPAGTWVRADGSGARLSFTTPEGNRQLFRVEYAQGDVTLQGEALVDGTTVYATRHTGTAANDLCLYLYNRRAAGGGVEAIWGSARAINAIAYEQASSTRTPEGWDGVYAEWGNNNGGRYQDRLIIGRSLEGAQSVHRLHWTQPSGGWYRGMAFEFDEKLVGVRLPGVLVRQRSYDLGAYTVVSRRSEVGRDVLWFLGAYRLEGDSLVGVELSNTNETTHCEEDQQRCLVPVRWVREGAAVGAPVQQAPIEAPLEGGAAAAEPGTATPEPTESPAGEAASAEAGGTTAGTAPAEGAVPAEAAPAEEAVPAEGAPTEADPNPSEGGDAPAEPL